MILQEDTVLPEQFLPSLVKRWEKDPNVKLYYNNLKDVIDILAWNCRIYLKSKYQKKGPVRDRLEQRLVAETLAWVMDDNDYPDGISFQQTCAALQINPEIVRRFLLDKEAVANFVWNRENNTHGKK